MSGLAFISQSCSSPAAPWPTRICTGACAAAEDANAANAAMQARMRIMVVSPFGRLMRPFELEKAVAVGGAHRDFQRHLLAHQPELHFGARLARGPQPAIERGQRAGRLAVHPPHDVARLDPGTRRGAA